jgi:hypothetical protein
MDRYNAFVFSWSSTLIGWFIGFISITDSLGRILFPYNSIWISSTLLSVVSLINDTNAMPIKLIIPDVANEMENLMRLTMSRKHLLVTRKTSIRSHVTVALTALFALFVKSQPLPTILDRNRCCNHDEYRKRSEREQSGPRRLSRNRVNSETITKEITSSLKAFSISSKEQINRAIIWIAC